MITADSITCRIPSVNAIKNETITCTTSLMETTKGLEVFWLSVGAIGSFGAMVVTIFMARYAWKAWDTSRKQLEHSAREAVLLRRQPALIDFLRILRKLFEESDSKPSGLSNPSIEEVRFYSDIWILSYPKLVKADCIWRLLVSCEAVLQKKKSAEYILNNDDVKELNSDLVEQLEGVLITAFAHAHYAFDLINSVSLELHRGERTEEEAIESYEILEKSTERALRKLDEVFSL